MTNTKKYILEQFPIQHTKDAEQLIYTKNNVDPIFRAHLYKKPTKIVNILLSPAIEKAHIQSNTRNPKIRSCVPASHESKGNYSRP